MRSVWTLGEVKLRFVRQTVNKKPIHVQRNASKTTVIAFLTAEINMKSVMMGVPVTKTVRKVATKKTFVQVGTIIAQQLRLSQLQLLLI